MTENIGKLCNRYFQDEQFTWANNTEVDALPVCYRNLRDCMYYKRLHSTITLGMCGYKDGGKDDIRTKT